MKTMIRSSRNPVPTTEASPADRSAPPWRVLFWLQAVLLLLAALTARAQYAPFGTNVWPWNVNLTNLNCSASGTYVITGGVFNTTSLTAPPSVGPPGATMTARYEVTPNGTVAVFSFPSLVITGAVEAVGVYPLVIEACDQIVLASTIEADPGELGAGLGGAGGSSGAGGPPMSVPNGGWGGNGGKAVGQGGKGGKAGPAFGTEGTLGKGGKGGAKGGGTSKGGKGGPDRKSVV